MKDKTKIIAVITLVIAVIGITVGFAAFSSTLTITSSTTASLVEAACEVITYSITVDDSTENHISTTSTVNNIDGFKLVKTADDTYDPFNGIQVMISYSESARADGPFDVSLGYIKLYYSTAD